MKASGQEKFHPFTKFLTACGADVRTSQGHQNMSWAMFIDESGQDQRQSPYEVLAGVTVEDRQIWPLIQALSHAESEIFGGRRFDSYGHEAKAKKMLNRSVFAHADQMEKIDELTRSKLASELLSDGTVVTRLKLTALAQAKIAFCTEALKLCEKHGAKAFASIVPRTAPRGEAGKLRKDYAFLFERFFYFLNGRNDDPMGYLVFDELDKSSSQILLNQVGEYFGGTKNGRTRSRLIIPEPFFVHSDLTTLIQVADIIAYVVSWSVRLKGMSEPKRSELDGLAAQVKRLRFHQETPGGHTMFGFKLISDLRPANAQ